MFGSFQGSRIPKHSDQPKMRIGLRSDSKQPINVKGEKTPTQSPGLSNPSLQSPGLHNPPIQSVMKPSPTLVQILAEKPTMKRDKTKSLFMHLGNNPTIEKQIDVVEQYQVTIDKLIETLEKQDSLNFKYTYEKEHITLVNELFEKFPLEIINYGYKHSTELRPEELFLMKDLLFKVEEAIKTIHEKVPYIMHQQTYKREMIPSFVFKDGEKHNNQKELLIIKMQLRKSYFDLYGIVQSIKLIEMNDSLKSFNEKVSIVSETLKRRREKLMNEKRAELLKMSLKTESKGLEIDEKGEVVSGSIDALIRWAVNPNIDNNIKFLETLLITYRQYLSPRAFFSKLISIYKECIEGTSDKQQKDIHHKIELKVVLMLCK